MPLPNIGLVDGNTGRSEGATAEKAVPFPCAVLDPNRSFVELRVREPLQGLVAFRIFVRTPIRPNSAWKALASSAHRRRRVWQGPARRTRQRRVGALRQYPSTVSATV